MDKEYQEALIDYYEYLLQKQENYKNININKYKGSLKDLEVDPPDFQKSIRDEW